MPKKIIIMKLMGKAQNERPSAVTPGTENERVVCRLQGADGSIHAYKELQRSGLFTKLAARFERDKLRKSPNLIMVSPFTHMAKINLRSGEPGSFSRIVSIFDRSVPIGDREPLTRSEYLQHPYLEVTVPPTTTLQDLRRFFSSLDSDYELRIIDEYGLSAERSSGITPDTSMGEYSLALTDRWVDVLIEKGNRLHEERRQATRVIPDIDTYLRLYNESFILRSNQGVELSIRNSATGWEFALYGEDAVRQAILDEICRVEETDASGKRILNCIITYEPFADDEEVILIIGRNQASGVVKASIVHASFENIDNEQYFRNQLVSPYNDPIIALERGILSDITHKYRLPPRATTRPL